jgi:Family of unknown function (DUF6152)
MRKSTAIVTAIVAAIALPLTGHAHHSFAAEFDATKVVHLEGTVVQFSWVNPHSWIYMDVKKPDGSVDHWKIEGGAPSLLLRRGWNKNSVQAGIKIIVDAYQARDGALRASARDVVFPDGRKLDAASSYQQPESK